MLSGQNYVLTLLFLYLFSLKFNREVVIPVGAFLSEEDISALHEHACLQLTLVQGSRFEIINRLDSNIFAWSHGVEEGLDTYDKVMDY